MKDPDLNQRNLKCFHISFGVTCLTVRLCGQHRYCCSLGDFSKSSMFIYGYCDILPSLAVKFLVENAIGGSLAPMSPKVNNMGRNYFCSEANFRHLALLRSRYFVPIFGEI